MEIFSGLLVRFVFKKVRLVLCVSYHSSLGKYANLLSISVIQFSSIRETRPEFYVMPNRDNNIYLL